MSPTAATEAALTPVESAALEHIALRDHRIHPVGRWDGQHFWLADHERQPCCARIDPPTWRWPYRQMSHARTAEHVAQRAGVDLRALRSAARRLRRMGIDRFAPADAVAVLLAAKSYPDDRVENMLTSWDGTAAELMELAARL